jgi:hypothetical protein
MPTPEGDDGEDGTPPLEMSILGEDRGTAGFYVMKDFWSSSTVRRHPAARPVRVPMKSFNEELDRLRPGSIMDIEGGEHDFVRFARLDGVRAVCVGLHPGVIGRRAMAEAEAFSQRQVFREDHATSDRIHKLHVRESLS